MSLYPVYQELIPPTAVYHCVSGPLLDENATNLVVAKGSLLEVYSLVTEEGDVGTPTLYNPSTETCFIYEDQPNDYLGDGDLTLAGVSGGDVDSSEIRTLQALSQASTDTSKLRLVLRVPVQGQIESICLVRTANTEHHGRYSLVVSFSEAKMALLEYSPVVHRLITVSIHYYENDLYKQEYLVQPWSPRLLTDPDCRCVVMQVYRDHLAVLPLLQVDSLGLLDLAISSTPTFNKRGVTVAEMDHDLNAGPTLQRVPYLPSFILRLPELDPPVRGVLDVAFLHGYDEPTLAILYEAPEVTWTGNLRHIKDTCAVIVVSLDLEKQTSPMLYHRKGLPYDCFQLIPVPIPTGGMMVVAANALIHLDQGSSGVGVQVNVMGQESKYTDFPLQVVDITDNQLASLGPAVTKGEASPQLLLERSQGVFLDPTTLLLSLTTGQLLLVRCQSHGRSVSGLFLALVGYSVVPSCVARISNELLFLGSATGDSLLIRVRAPPKGLQTAPLVSHGTPSVPQSDLTGNNLTNNDEDDDEEWDEELYGPKPTTGPTRTGNSTAAATASSSGTKYVNWYAQYRFRICDALLNLAPAQSLCVGPTATSSHLSDTPDSPAEQASEEAMEIVLSSGHGRSGTLSILQRSIRPEIIASFDFPDYQHMWSVRVAPANPALSTWGTGDSLYSGNNYGPDVNELQDKYILISKSTSTIVLTVRDGLEQVEDTDFYTQGETLKVASWDTYQRIVQVYPHGIRLLDGDAKLIHELPLDLENASPPVRIQDCQILCPYILLTLDDGTIQIFTQNPNKRQLQRHSVPSRVTMSSISSACLFEDQYGSLSQVGDVIPAQCSLTKAFLKTDHLPGDSDASSMKPTQHNPNLTSSTTMMMDDDMVDFDMADDVGEAGRQAIPDGVSGEVTETNVSTLQQGFSASTSSSLWCFIYRLSGVLEVYTLPHFHLVYCAPGLDHLPSVVSDSAITECILGNPLPGEASSHTNVEDGTKKSTFSLASSGRHQIQEIKVEAFGPTLQEVYLCILYDSDRVVLYHAFPYHPVDEDPLESVMFLNVANTRSVGKKADDAQVPTVGEGHQETGIPRTTSEKVPRSRLALRLVKCSTPSDVDIGTNNKMGERVVPSEISPEAGYRSGGRIHTFGHIQGQRGFFIGGNSPVWAMVSAASAYPYVHPMRYWQANSVDIDTTSTADPTESPTPEEFSDSTAPKQTLPRAVIGFVPLNIRDNDHGFAFIDQDHRLHIAQLPALPNYHFAWPLLRIPFGRAVHQVVYHPIMRSYCIVTSETEAFQMSSDDLDSDPEAEAVNIRKELPPEILMNIAKSNAAEDPSQPEDPTPRVEPTVPRFALELVSPVTWEVVDRFDFPANEHVSALKCVSLRSKET
ncbi:mRNA cleavage and polyadenylation factor subunit, partial [Dispira parvispora]